MEEGRILDVGRGAVNPTAIRRAYSPGGERAMSGESALVRGYPIERVGRDGRRSDVDRVTIEEPLEIRIGADTLAVTMRTPGNDFELAAGFLAAEGIVSEREEILRIEHCREVRFLEEEGNVVVVRTTAPASVPWTARAGSS